MERAPGETNSPMSRAWEHETRQHGRHSPEKVDPDPGRTLFGRRSERDRIDGLVAAALGGKSSTVVLEGVAGVGKSALLDYAATKAVGFRVLRAAGAQSETEIPFSALHQLCAPVLDRLDDLPAPQRSALEVALGSTSGPPPDQLAIGLAVLGLLASVAAEKPLLCLIDDAHWIDHVSESVLAFAARRLLADRVAVVIATRHSSDHSSLRGLPTARLAGLGPGDSRALLESTLLGPLDPRVRDHVLSEAEGNPLAIITFANAASPADAAGGFGLPSAVGVADRLESTFRQELAELPPTAQQLLVVAAADPTGDITLLWRAADALDIFVDIDLLEACATIVVFDSGVRFRHPLVRSAVYRSATPRQRLEAHRALAAATDPEIDPDRRAWHAARATVHPDAAVAADLENSAARARARGGLAAAAAFLEQSALLTPDARLRSSRMLDAARVRFEAGGPVEALNLVSRAEGGRLDELQRAQLALLRAQISSTSDRSPDTTSQLLAAAKRLEPLDASLARATYLDAFAAATIAGRLARSAGVREVAEAARNAPGPSTPTSATDLLLDGLTVTATAGTRAGIPLLRKAFSAFGSSGLDPRIGLGWLWFASHTALATWDDVFWDDLSVRHVQLARETGAIAVLPVALNTRVGVAVGLGDLGDAARVLDEVESLAEVTGVPSSPYVGLALLAVRGREDEVRRGVEATEAEVEASGEGIGLTVAHWSAAVTANALGRYPAALEAAERACEKPEELWSSGFGAVELVEAAARCGRLDRAESVLAQLSITTGASGTDFASGMEARCRALVTQGPEAEQWYLTALERLGRTRVKVELARAHLLYGEWLRRARRRSPARRELRVAHEMFHTMGMEAFMRRAEDELVAAGQTMDQRNSVVTTGLTAQESRVARLARDRLTNPEIGARLFISPRTVEYHLRNVFAKLGITSRHELANALAPHL